MAHVTRRRFNYKVSTVSLLIGSVETVIVNRGEGVAPTVQISVWELLEDGERDRMERYIFDLDETEAKKLMADLAKHFGGEK